ncbi:MAG TPA: hypothetical protein ENJ37_10900 [Deltaproteobacteria bacterium]|nr:hypothetical protein [Deltaproteobacteria bacterium]
MAGIITLTTDFGLSDPYVGAMKGVILSVNAGARIVDITHLVGACNIVEGALRMAHACPYFPDGTVHIGVVDPGVGGRRRPILVETARHFFVGPDNGIFGPVIESGDVKRVIHLTEKRYFHEPVSATFHGRDIFSPVAARLCLGEPPSSFGPEIGDPATLDLPSPQRRGDEVRGVVLYIDSFGNYITNISREDISHLKGRAVEVRLGDAAIEGLAKTYSDVAPGELTALFGSTGLLEVAESGGDAFKTIREGSGAAVTVRPLP